MWIEKSTGTHLSDFVPTCVQGLVFLGIHGHVMRIPDTALQALGILSSFGSNCHLGPHPRLSKSEKWVQGDNLSQHRVYRAPCIMMLRSSADVLRITWPCTQIGPTEAGSREILDSLNADAASISVLLLLLSALMTSLFGWWCATG